MTVSKLCEECIRFQAKGINKCNGKDAADVKPGKLPCKKYELDPQLISNQDIEPDSPPPSLKDRKPKVVKPLIPDSVLTVNKVKAANFERLAVKRLSVLLDGFRRLSNLSNKANYEWTQEQIDVMLSRIRGAADDLFEKFQK